MDNHTWFIYNLETKDIVRKFSANLRDAEDIYSFYDQDVYAMTNTPAFGCTDGLNELFTDIWR